MSQERLNALTKAFQEAHELNEKAIGLLNQGEPLDRLDGLFDAKSAVLESLQQVDLEALAAPEGPSEGLNQAFLAQRNCAQSETRLAEALAARRAQLKNVNQVTRAYGSKVVDKLGAKGLDLAS